MRYLTEDIGKQILRKTGLPVPNGFRAETPQAAADAAEQLGGQAVVKALVPTGRRGKANAVRLTDTPAEARKAAEDLLDATINGHLCKAVYVEERVDIASELYLSFILEDYPPRILASTEGGVEIETVHQNRPEAIITATIDPLKGLPVWDAINIWERAGLPSAQLPAVAKVTAALQTVFERNKGIMLELNPLVIDSNGRVSLVGAMMAIEDDTMAEVNEDTPRTDREMREDRVRKVSRELPGGMVRYTELDGNIGMFVGGGGAGLHQHDLILAAGGRPANHTDASTQNPDKVRELIDVILDNPQVKSLFISWHYQQMAQIDKRVIPALEALTARGIDAREFPVVIRMFGQGEEAARSAAAAIPGVHYLPHGAPMTDGIDLIVRLTAKARSQTQMEV
ncbi:ATP-grasp domain-containing protein [Roseinatronobacter bogoriensis]|uniref:ATP-grasp domain-containing protein n=1 Tax=Roseinatronobacter bogoriensis subsp. barguzinensis TaxID=441209 RepID=A0A2K8KKE3_9RHOB|nr:MULTISPECIES: ATP-grasp domain-containing protein [Rhodobaca]ATX67548.1 hypothetical protein BG454_18445 [Rhodobaca barguzinensis]MBB4209702.1 succinyl-CoA synthetase beta subunit/citryl-CoA synthetase large subunit [Rhodobaca bogoriensis DSM 18756]TDW33877.1 succinyl-CoA synthetase beta subunit/citryl-CoA synthetase large subunit [Rhodobaca barguzinensis]TDY66273.1 succinyl-CoA synthetase beta subunit/citryl-CoA synthetase large subunit [Rhodobaca bogoriensis DSM 18756]